MSLNRAAFTNSTKGFLKINEWHWLFNLKRNGFFWFYFRVFMTAYFASIQFISFIHSFIVDVFFFLIIITSRWFTTHVPIDWHSLWAASVNCPLVLLFAAALNSKSTEIDLITRMIFFLCKIRATKTLVLRSVLFIDFKKNFVANCF